MLFTDEDLFGGHQTDIFEALAEIAEEAETPNNQEATVSEFKRGEGIRYHGSVCTAHGEGYVLGTDANGRLTIHVRPDEADAWRPQGFRITNVRPTSVTRLAKGVDYGDEPGHIDLFGAGQLVLGVV